MEESWTFTESFQRELTFRKFYDFLKMQKQYKYSSLTQHESCKCEIWENAKLLTSAVNQKLKNVDSKLSASVKEIVGGYSCDIANENCKKNNCTQCSSLTITDSDFEDSSSSSFNSEDLSSANRANINLFKVSNKRIKKRCEICWKLTIKTAEWRQWRHSGVFIVEFQHISHLFLLFLLLTLNK